MRLYIARHGSADKTVNAKGFPQILGGSERFDKGLNAKGVEQARELGAVQLKGVMERIGGFDAVYASDLKRALETASMAMAACGHDGLIRQDARINERHFGDYSGAFCDEMALDRDFLACMKHNALRYLPVPPGWAMPQDLERALYDGNVDLKERIELTNILSINNEVASKKLEPVTDIVARLTAFEDCLLREHGADSNIAVFCHGDVLKVWMHKVATQKGRYDKETVVELMARDIKNEPKGIYRQISHCDLFVVGLA